MFGPGRLLSVSDDEFTQETRSTQKTRYIILRQISKRTDNIRQRDISYATDEAREIITAHVRALSKNGVVTHNSIGKRKSIISVSSEQREAIDSLLTLIDKFKNGDRETIGEGRRFAESVLNDPNLFSELMLKAKEASPFANRTNREDVQCYLISIIQNNPNCTIYQVLQTLEEDYNKRLSRKGVFFHLSNLVRQGRIVSEKTKSWNVRRVNVYTVVENPDNQAALPQS